MRPNTTMPGPTSTFSPNSARAEQTEQTPSTTLTLAEVPRLQAATLVRVSGPRVFRRRLLEMGLVPGVDVTVVNVAPLGDPLELEVRQCRLSIRRSEAAAIEVAMAPSGRRQLEVLP